MKKIISAVLFFVLSLVIVLPAFADPFVDPAVEMRRMQELYKQEELMYQLQQEQKAYDQYYDEKKREKKNKDLPYMERVYVLKQISVQDSKILTQEELNPILKPWLDREVTMKQIHELVDAVTELYRKKGDEVSKAYLPEEPVVAGTLLIALRERATPDDNILNHKEETLKNMLNIK
ncbi:MAG: POTRA domain-containing protein [Synergistaceae bacterium]|nr:POTRA domain-containing protein [Synergistaceae bacterium]